MSLSTVSRRANYWSQEQTARQPPAALVTENKTLCFPASVDSIPTSLGQEDHVSMGSISGRKLSQVLDNLEYILAIELMSACQAIEMSDQ